MPCEHAVSNRRHEPRPDGNTAKRSNPTKYSSKPSRPPGLKSASTGSIICLVIVEVLRVRLNTGLIPFPLQTATPTWEHPRENPVITG